MSFSVILVPGVSASTLEQQTCSHFPEFIESCYAVPGSPLTVWVFNHGVTPRTRECWDTFIAAGEQLLKEILLVTDTDDEVSQSHLYIISELIGVADGSSIDRSPFRCFSIEKSHNPRCSQHKIVAYFAHRP